MPGNISFRAKKGDSKAAKLAHIRDATHSFHAEVMATPRAAGSEFKPDRLYHVGKDLGAVFHGNGKVTIMHRTNKNAWWAGNTRFVTPKITGLAKDAPSIPFAA